MKRNSRLSRSAGFTLVEICICLAVLVGVGGIAYSMLLSSTTLLAKNLSINSSNIIVRSTLDRIFSELNQANRQPILVNSDGTPTGATGPAAGVAFDRYLGGPYIVGNPGSGLAASATTLKMFYSTNPMACPPVPQKDDVVIMDGQTRALVASATTSTSFSAPTPTPVPNPGAMATVTLQSTLGTYAVPPVATGTAIPWSSGTQQTAYIVHRKAFVVVPVNGVGGPAAELRLYPSAETLPSVINDPTKYVVLSREIGTRTINGLTEHTPFSLTTQNAATFLNVALRMEDQKFNRRLATQQVQEFNTFLRVDTMLRPRNIP